MPNLARPQLQTIAAISVAVGLLVLGLKFMAWRVTGSVALFSDALESIVNVATAIAALVAIRLSAKPADANHPYGHHKAEYFSAVLEGVLVVIAALLVFREAWFAYQAPRLLDQPATGLAFNGAATIVNGVWCWYLIRQARARRSPALAADGRHLLTDVVTSVGVFVGLLLALATGLAILDPIIAAAVALNILWSGWRTIRESIGGLMDEAVAAETLERIRAVIAASAGGALEVHDLRTRAAGRATFIDFHMVVAGNMPVTEAHAICDRIEKALRVEVTDALITIHVEPEEKAKHHGVLVL